MKHNKRLFYCRFSATLIVVLFGGLLLTCFSSCKRGPRLEFCVKPAEEGAAVNDCGTVFTTGEFMIRYNKLAANHGKMELYFYDTQDEDKTPLDIIPVEPDSEGKTLLYEMAIYDEGSYRFELHGEKGKIAEGTISIVEKRKTLIDEEE